MPPQVSFEAISAELYMTGFDDTLAQVSYQIKDAIGKNWYMLKVQQIETDELLDLLNPNSFTCLPDDSSFDGQDYAETVRVFPRDFSPGDTIAVSFSTFSEDYHNYMKLRLDNRFSIIEYLSEPVNYPSNIVGGKGLF